MCWNVLNSTRVVEALIRSFKFQPVVSSVLVEFV